jgi:hypothetical protein
MFNRLRSLFRVLTRRRDFEDGMSEELRFHIEQYADDLVRSGMSPEKAARRARMEFGSLDGVKGDCREERGLHLFDEFRRELSYAARLLRKTPGFTATALLTLAVCLGANLTIFAVIDSALASLAIYSYGTEIMGEAGSTERDQTMRVSPDFFSTLGLGPVIGRSFTDEETTSQTDHVAILSDAFWRQRYNADPHVIGKLIRVNSVPRTVIGVLPAAFHFLSSDARLFLPLASRAEDRTPSRRHAGGNVIQMIATSPVSDRRAERGIGSRRPPGQDDGRCGLPFHSGVIACRPRRSNPSHSTAVASRRDCPSLNRRSQPCKPAPRPCQRSS